MVLVNRRKISLYDEAKAGLSSLVKQTAQAFVGLLVMLLLTGGSPPAFVVSLSFCLGTAFVAWSEKKRLTFEEANSSDPETLVDDIEQQKELSEDALTEKAPQPNVYLTNVEQRLLPQYISRMLQDISRNRRQS